MHLISKRSLFTSSVGITLMCSTILAHAQLAETAPTPRGTPAAPNMLHLNPSWTLSPPVTDSGAPKPVRTRTIVDLTTKPLTADRLIVLFAPKRTESEARVSLETWQAKYPMLLGEGRATIRANRGEKDISHTAVVEPFEVGRARDMCDSMKAIGAGSCIIVEKD